MTLLVIQLDFIEFLFVFGVVCPLIVIFIRLMFEITKEALAWFR